MSAVTRQLENMTQRASSLTDNLDEIRGNNNKLMMKSNILNTLITNKDSQIDDYQTQMQTMELKLED